MTAPVRPRPRRGTGGSPDAAWARFDDLISGSSVMFPSATRIVEATALDEVVEVVAEVERATAAGAWAFGFLSYEAAAAFAPELMVRVRGLARAALPAGLTPAMPAHW